MQAVRGRDIGAWCLGPATGGSKWMVSPDAANEIVVLEFHRKLEILMMQDYWSCFSRSFLDTIKCLIIPGKR